MSVRILQLIVWVLWMGAVATPGFAQFGSGLLTKKKKYDYQKVDVTDMIRRYVAKPSSSPVSIEGIYSVSAVVVKRGKGLLSSEVREKVVDRKDNYASVAIMRDREGAENEFIEVSLTQKGAPEFPIVATLTTLSEERGFLSKHIEPDGEILTFTFTYHGDSDILEGVYTKSSGGSTITYTLTYLKTYPKKQI
ncbi:MAG TPA: hypothetical protein VD816_05495 [Ohtaekwangia sp.]|nr:hypothetical protein [Ohtaekwangia sp.]